MVANLVNEEQSLQMAAQEQEANEYIGCSVGIMAYNEEANIERTLRAILDQQSLNTRIEEVIVVASGCTDHTVPLVDVIARQESKVAGTAQSCFDHRAGARVAEQE